MSTRVLRAGPLSPLGLPKLVDTSSFQPADSRLSYSCNVLTLPALAPKQLTHSRILELGESIHQEFTDKLKHEYEQALENQQKKLLQQSKEDIDFAVNETVSRLDWEKQKEIVALCSHYTDEKEQLIRDFEAQLKAKNEIIADRDQQIEQLRISHAHELAELSTRLENIHRDEVEWLQNSWKQLKEKEVEATQREFEAQLVETKSSLQSSLTEQLERQQEETRRELATLEQKIRNEEAALRSLDVNSVIAMLQTERHSFDEEKKSLLATTSELQKRQTQLLQYQKQLVNELLDTRDGWAEFIEETWPYNPKQCLFAVPPIKVPVDDSHLESRTPIISKNQREIEIKRKYLEDFEKQKAQDFANLKHELNQQNECIISSMKSSMEAAQNEKIQQFRAEYNNRIELMQQQIDQLKLTADQLSEQLLSKTNDFERAALEYFHVRDVLQDFVVSVKHLIRNPIAGVIHIDPHSVAIPVVPVPPFLTELQPPNKPGAKLSENQSGMYTEGAKKSRPRTGQTKGEARAADKQRPASAAESRDSARRAATRTDVVRPAAVDLQSEADDLQPLDYAELLKLREDLPVEIAKLQQIIVSVHCEKRQLVFELRRARQALHTFVNEAFRFRGDEGRFALPLPKIRLPPSRDMAADGDHV